MTNTTPTLPATRAEAEQAAAAEALRRFTVRSWNNPAHALHGDVGPDGLEHPPVLHGVFDEDAPQHEGTRFGMVWRPASGFLAGPDREAVGQLAAQVRIEFVLEAMAVWDELDAQRRLAAEEAERVHAPAVVRLDRPDASEAEAVARLDVLTRAYDRAASEAKAAEEALAALKDQIKAELWQLRPGSEDVTLVSPHLSAPLGLKLVRQRVFDTAAAKKALTGEQWDALCADRTSWRLAARKA